MRRPAAMAIVVTLLLVSFVVAPVTAAGQNTTQDDPAATATATADGSETSEDDASISNTGVLLFGSVLLAGGIWAYQNREKRGYRY